MKYHFFTKNNRMKLIKQAKLNFKEGKSDKVYEIDLCQLGENEFLVNFRYGRRDTNLQEGTKTTFPVSLEEAEKLFIKLKESKTKKGYKESGDSQSSIITINSEQENVRESKILSYLKTVSKGGKLTNDWPLSRIIWRCLLYTSPSPRDA